jgi:uncharacterized protein YjiS (DUF1127 family)
MPKSTVLSLQFVQSQTVNSRTQNDRVRSLRILCRMDAWLRRVLFRRELRRILETGDYLLDDLGFDPDAAATEIRRRFWQPVALKQRHDILEEDGHSRFARTRNARPALMAADSQLCE